jgi:hypothetical protein
MDLEEGQMLRGLGGLRGYKADGAVGSQIHLDKVGRRF